MNNNLHFKIVDNYVINVKKIITKFNELKELKEFNDIYNYGPYNYENEILFKDKIKKIKNNVIYNYLTKKYITK